MKKILAFGASNSQSSINRQLASYAAAQLADSEVNLIDLNDFEMPIYGVDRQQADGIPEPALRFKQLLREADAVLISFAEHNGSYATVFKNLLDWSSRIEKDMWLGKPMFLLATSPGGRGGLTVLTQAKNYFPFMNAKVLASFSLPHFGQNFSPSEGILDETLRQEFAAQLALFEQGEIVEQ